MNIVAIMNYKGGVGKTTVTANLASELAWRGKKVLLIDTDAQSSLTFSLIKPEEWDSRFKANHTIKSWFDSITKGISIANIEDFIIKPVTINNRISESKKGGCVDLICSHLGLINVDLDLATLLGGANMTQSKINYLKVHNNLRKSLEYIRSKNKYDIVLIDCPPNFNIVTKNAIIASEKILVPAKPDYLSTMGIDYLIRSVKELTNDFNEYAKIDETVSEISPGILGVVFTMIQHYGNQPISAQQQYISQVSRIGVSTFTNYFRENKSIFSSAPEDLLPVVLRGYNNQGKDGIVNEIENFVSEFELSLL